MRGGRNRPEKDFAMSPEFYAIIGTGIVLAGIILTQSARLNSRVDRLEQGYAGLRERMAKLEGLLEGLREAIAGHRPPSPTGSD